VSPREHPTVVAAKLRERTSPRQELRARGVVHTPMALARFGLQRVDAHLRERFGLTHGLADPNVLLLDPAVGTGVWLAAALSLAEASGAARAMWGFDLDEQALASTRAALTAELGARDVELSLRCENTLAVADPWPPEGGGVRVVVGNPPWAARSASRGTPLSDAWLAEFRRDASGAPLGERRVGVLSDDYVRFFRWALEQARTAPAGAVVCLATNGSFLDGPVHRGMRAALRAHFDLVEVLDLGGNALLARGDERDENVFGVRVGAALTVAVRERGAGPRRARVALARVSGTRAQKLAALSQVRFEPASLSDPHAPFRAARAPAARGHERAEFSLADAFPFHREGLQTNRDALATAPTLDALWARLEQIADGRHALVASAHFDPARALLAARGVLAQGAGSPHLRKLAYRPLQTRYVCAVAPLCHRPRPDLLAAVAQSSLCLLSSRKDRGSLPFSLFAAASDVADACFLSTRSSCRTRVFPSHDPTGRPNISPAVHERFARHDPRFAPERLIEYALGVLCSGAYRREQGERLKDDYPRVPFPEDPGALAAFVAAGRVAIEALSAPHAHLLTAGARFTLEEADAPAELAIDLRQLRFSADDERVRVAGRPLLRGVSADIWDGTIGHMHWRRLGPQHVTLAQLLDLLRRSAHWLRAAESADAAFSAHFARLGA